MIELKLPWPPTINHYKQVGLLIKTKKGKIYQTRVNSIETKTFYFKSYMACKEQMVSEGLKFRYSKEIELEVMVYLHPPNKRPYDADNRLKALLDSLMQNRIIEDDVQITRLVVEKSHMIDEGQAIVKIREFVKCI